MALTLRKQADDQVTPPASAARVAFYVDLDGIPKTKDSSGAIAEALSLVGGPVTLNTVAAPAAETDKGKVYVKGASGVSELFYRDDLGNGGNEVQLTQDGAVAPGSGGGSFPDDPEGKADVSLVCPDGGNTGLVDTTLDLTPPGSVWVAYQVAIWQTVSGDDSGGGLPESDLVVGVLLFDDSVDTPNNRLVDFVVESVTGFGNDVNLDLFNVIADGSILMQYDDGVGGSGPWNVDVTLTIGPPRTLTVLP